MAQQFIILPSSGLTADSGQGREMLLEMAAASHGADPRITLAGMGDVRILDVVQETGAKLVETDEATAAAINQSAVPIRALPLVEYPKPRIFPHAEVRALGAGAGATAMVVSCRDGSTGGPVAGATVIGFTDFANNFGDRAVTDAQGQATLMLAGNSVERLYVYPPANYWGAYRAGLPVANLSIDLEPVDLAYVDCVRHYYGATRFDPAVGVTVGVLDSGCGPHPDLNLMAGCATVTGESAQDWSDYDIHGTHVSGLIGASGGLRGMAPGVGIRAYRVFPMNGDGATNYAVLKAMFLAAQQGCDIINLSLGGGPFDFVVEEAIEDACNQGMLVVVAAGNDDRSAVSYPAAYQGALAVSALGRETTFPAGSVEEGDVLRPPQAADPLEFLAAFSNVGPEIAVAAPGVGTLSTLPNGDYGPLSGTSMAAPVVAGAAACLLSQNPAVFAMPRNRSRSQAIYNLVVQNCARRHFGSTFEGFGMPDPAVV
ncbi:MAG TPA: S8 family serine peptidase [Allosphingosinicella sp.]|jgi:subtilisin